MRKLLLPVLIFISTLTFAQSEKKGFFRNLYKKFSPTLFIPVDGNLTPAAFASIGLKIHKYVALGVSGGYFSYNQEAKGVIPWGIELTVTNFKAKKITPVIIAQLFKPDNYKKIEEEHWSTPYTNSAGSISYQTSEDKLITTGKSLFSVAAGAIIPLHKNKLAFTAGFSQLTWKKDFSHRTFNPSVGRSWRNSEKTYQNILMANISLSYIF